MKAPKRLQQLGLAGALGLFMLCGAGWAFWSWLPKQQATIDELGSQSRRLRHELQAKLSSERQGASAAAMASPQAAWQVLWQGLPDAGQGMALQSDVLASAGQHGLRISAVQYRGAAEPWSAHEGQLLWRQRLSMPVDGSYPAVRAWLAHLLKQPALAIDALDIQRDDASRGQVKARISVSLYWRQAAEARP